MRINKFKQIHNTPPEHNLCKVLSGFKLKNGGKQTAEEWNAILQQLLQKKTSQENIYAYLRNELKQTVAFENIGRAAKLADNLIDALPRFKKKTSYNSLLDVGCATGTITEALMQKLNIPSSRTFGTDIDDYPITKFNFIKTTQQTTRFDTIADRSIDLITCSMCLHHIENIDAILAELARVISQQGILIIREHDCPDQTFAYYLDIIHGLYEISLAETPNLAFLRTYEAYYKRQTEWRQIISAAGFRCVYQSKPVSNYRAYYGVFALHKV